MKDEPKNAGWLAYGAAGTPGMPVLAGRAAFQAERDALHPPALWHDHAADRLKGILKDAARLAGAEVYVAGRRANTFPSRAPDSITARPCPSTRIVLRRPRSSTTPSLVDERPVKQCPPPRGTT